MDYLSKLQGKELPEILSETYAIFIPELLRNESILSARPETHQYGHCKAQSLDIYFPKAESAKNAGHKPPIVIFAFGGGYTWNAKQYKVPNETVDLMKKEGHAVGPDIDKLYHQNMGTFIAARGFIAVVIDYRLVNMDSTDIPYAPTEDEGQFPTGGEDILLALKWVVENLSGRGNTDEIFLLGHSSGANHICTFLLEPSIGQSHTKLLGSVKGVGCVGATYDYVQGRPQRKVAWSRYFGSYENIFENCCTALARKVHTTSTLPPIACLYAAREPPEVLEPQARFYDAWMEKGGSGILKEVPGKWHNHMSTIVAIGSQDRECELWLSELLDWFQFQHSHK